MKQTIEAKEQELKRIFSDDYLFEIPAYQRPYSWTTEQAGELLDDLLSTMGHSEPIEDVAPYFLGSIVLIKDPLYARAEVVDGQQRLTTLTILIAVIRDLCDDTVSKSNLEKYICEKGDKFAGSEDRFRLTLRDRDSEFFRKSVQTGDGLKSFLKQDSASLTDSRKRVYENAKHFQAELSNLDQETRDRLTMFLLQRCFLVVVSASDQQSAYRVFSVMNDRGLDLSPTDILKADIIGAMPEHIRSNYNDQWEEIEEDLGREDFRDLFSHIRMIFAQSKARGNLNHEFRESVLKVKNGEAFIDDVLVPYAEAYQIVSYAAYESTADAEVVNRYLDHLSRLDNYDWVPPAIAFFRKHVNEHEKLVRFAIDLERLAYGLFIQRANINQRIGRYASVLRAIEAGQDLGLEDSPLQLTAEEKASIIEALNGPIYLQTRVRMPLLLRLDSLLSDSGVSYEHKVLSIEHVLPQNPDANSEWLSLFHDPETRNLWTHRLANLVLLSRQKNSQAKNFDFGRKKTEYFQKKGVATFALTSQVLNEPNWTIDVLEKRQKELLKVLISEWRLGF
ncbi:DUF262 domain-containing protein [Thalassospira sp. SM2505]